MSEAQELRQAAERLRELAAAAPNGPWHYRGNVERDYEGHLVETALIEDGLPTCAAIADDADTARWIAAMSPPVAEPLAQLLTEAANDLDNNGAHPFKYAHHLDFARAINGTETTR